MSDGVSGYEENVAKIIKTSLSKICSTVKTDNLGNVIGKIGKNEKKIMIAAHMDEIGMIVKYVDEKGYIYFVKIGGINDSILPGKIVKIINKKGNNITGIIGTKPPHITTFERPIRYNNMFIDIGLSSRDKVLKILDIGDQIIFEPNAGILNNDFYYGKATDNRIGCYVMIKIMEILTKIKNLNAEVYACATTQEEVGLKGGKTSSFKINPDFALIIDTTISGDVPGIEEKISALKLGRGVAITIMEASGRGTIVSQKVRKLMIDTASKNKIPYQIDIIDGGTTDGAAIYINREGILTGILSIPTRYIHAPTSVFNIKDINSTIKLAVKTIEEVIKEF
jgi:endoglucanase